jgi:transposase-like protein
MKKVPASEATRKRLEAVFSGEQIDPGRLVREATRLLIEQALEAEVEQALGRGYYEHGQAAGEDAAARPMRNGVRRGHVDSAEGVIEFDAPQLRGLSGWKSEVRAALAGKSEELSRLAVEMYARGLSMRDIEAAFTDGAGRCVLSRSAASAVCERLWQQYQAFARRDLSELDIAYLFLDGVAERLHLGQPREAVLAAWGIDVTGVKHLLGLLPGLKESTSACVEFLRDLTSRGLRDPVLVVTDGAPGAIAAVEQVFPASLRQRCLAHKMRNLENKVPAERWREVGPAARAVYQASSPALARLAREEFVKAWSPELPSAVACFEDDFEACIAHLRLPIGHRRAIRTTNLLERMFGEERRRTKVIPHAFGERAVMKLMFAALMRARQGWRNVIVTAFEARQIEQLREQLRAEFNQRHSPPATPASRQRIHSTQRT